ncbi:DUF488 domain-containing protein [Limibacillus halophilus]|uniref:Uncharacterized protein (DUF488 family) n=1 Tax=Limibacillus halophilus TaxID=1579333 RepID=A0A839SWR0_9PROT|nr:DUF488 domain-containing protein [Limibacillus halophilus]MBB3066942.1 uncharacterized protein (DUF488 family) [Limibacillus halophilus]
MHTLFTIGYEGTDISRFLKTLKNVGVTVLADVRAVPVSRKKGFSKNSLRSSVESVGIEYLPLRQLGDPKAGRIAARAGRYGEFREIYEKHLEQPDAVEAIKVLEGVSIDRSTCLLCFERAPETCHRSIIADRITRKGFSTLNLYADDPERYVRNPISVSSYSIGQSASAAE